MTFKKKRFIGEQNSRVNAGNVARRLMSAKKPTRNISLLF
jgi:hypothetical protein